MSDMSGTTAALRWDELATRVLEGHSLSGDEAFAILNCPDVELPSLLAATYRVRHRYWGNEVQFYSLRNAKSGLCPEDCGYCSQSKVSEAEIPKYRWNDEATRRRHDVFSARLRRTNTESREAPLP